MADWRVPTRRHSDSKSAPFTRGRCKSVYMSGFVFSRIQTRACHKVYCLSPKKSVQTLMRTDRNSPDYAPHIFTEFQKSQRCILHAVCIWLCGKRGDIVLPTVFKFPGRRGMWTQDEHFTRCIWLPDFTQSSIGWRLPVSETIDPPVKADKL